MPPCIWRSRPVATASPSSTMGRGRLVARLLDEFVADPTQPGHLQCLGQVVSPALLLSACAATRLAPRSSPGAFKPRGSVGYSRGVAGQCGLGALGQRVVPSRSVVCVVDRSSSSSALLSGLANR